MTDLTMRAEQALLGALLTGGAKNGELGGIQAGDFVQMRHRAIFAALTGAVPQPGGLLGRLRMWLAGLPLWPQVRDFRQYLAELPGSCPKPAHLPSYAQMVAEAGEQRREAAAQAEPDPHELGRIAGAAAYLAREAERAAANRRRPSNGQHAAADAVMARDTAIAARAVHHNQSRLALRSTQAAAGDRHPTMSELSNRPAQARPSRQTEAVQETESSVRQQVLTAEDLEELVLADLLQRPQGAREIVGWLPVEVFTSEARRVIYGDIRHRVQEGEPVDPLIIAWDLNRAQDLRRSSGEREAESVQALDPDYVLRVAAMDVAPGTAVLLGRALLADQVCTRRLGADWPKSLQPAQPASSPASEPAQTITPETQPGLSSQPHGEAAPTGPGREPVPAARPAAAGNGARVPVPNEAAAETDQVPVMEPPVVPEPAGPVQRM